MPAAVRILDSTNHGGVIVGPGVATVLIGNMPAAVAGDNHVCSLPPNTHQPTVSPFPAGSTTVFIAGLPALRTTDSCLCGAMALTGDATVMIGG